jgi:hypothetical protein
LAVIIMTSNLRVEGVLEILSQVKEKISHRGGELIGQGLSHGEHQITGTFTLH